MGKALEVIGEGRAYPMFYNSNVNIPPVSNPFHMEEERATD